MRAAEQIIIFGKSQIVVPSFVPRLANGTPATFFADFVANNYWGNNTQSANVLAWLTSMGGSFARASTVPFFQAGVLVNSTSGQPRLPTSPTSVKTGLRISPPQTELCLWNRDFTNAVWTKTTLTALKDQTGLDGVANSCSSLTVGASATGTVTQAITDAVSSRRSTAVWIKLISGSATVNITRNGGTTWTSLGAIPASFSQIPLNDTLTPTATTNPTVGLQIIAGAGGAVVAVDGFAHRQSVSSIAMNIVDPIFTTTVPVAMAGERILIPIGNIGTLVAFAWMQNQVFPAGGGGAPFGSDGAPPWEVVLASSAAYQLFNGAVSLAIPGTSTIANLGKVAVSGTPSARTACLNAGTVGSAATAMATQPYSNFVVGGGGASTAAGNMGGDMLRIGAFLNMTATNADLQALTT